MTETVEPYNPDGFLQLSLEPHPILILMVCLLVLIIYLIVKRKSSGERKIINAIFIFYIVWGLIFVFTPLQIWNPEFRAWVLSELGKGPLTWQEIATLDLVPFRSIIPTTYYGMDLFILSLYSIIGNILLLLPLPIFLGMLQEEKRSMKKMLLIGFLVSLSIELTQLSLNFLTGWPNRIVSVNDLILNTFGFYLGYLLFKKVPNFFYWHIDVIKKLFRV